jgi:hypothetical protein
MMTQPLNVRLRVEASEWDHDDKVAELLLEAAAALEARNLTAYEAGVMLKDIIAGEDVTPASSGT